MARLLWTQKQDIGPSARFGSDTSYDASAKRILLFGGQAGTVFVNDTWEWNGTDWTQVEDIGPQGRLDHRMAYDATRQRTVLFGGHGSMGLFGDTWEWDGDSWTQVADTGPHARYGHAITFDSVRNRVILFGGYDGVSAAALGDTWAWDGNEWTQEQDVGPPPRVDHRVVYDSVRDRIVLFGGSAVSVQQETVTDHNIFGQIVGSHTQTFTNWSLLGDTWEFDGALWTHVADTGPEARASYGLAFDGAETLLFGGQISANGSGATWSWDGKFWTQRQDMGPGGRWAVTMAYDSDRKRAVLFGGRNDATIFGDTWELSQYGIAQMRQDPLGNVPGPG